MSLGIYLLVSGRFREYTEVLKDKKTMKKIILSAAALSINWGAVVMFLIPFFRKKEKEYKLESS